MFRRLWTGLPDDPVFPEDLKELGYFVNDEDEIRSIQDPKYYFKYFIDKNMHWNDRQRFAMNTASQKIVLSRLEELGVQTIRLPLGAAPDEPHVRVLATDDLATADRVVLFVGETNQDLGILAQRVVGSAGGINKGSLMSMVERLRGTLTDTADSGEKPPAILVLNPGELFWWPEGRRALSLPMCQGMPRPSAAHLAPRQLPGTNVIPGHADAAEHVASVFHDLLEPLRLQSLSTSGKGGSVAAAAAPKLRLSVISIAGGADALEAFLDQDANWRRWGPHMDSLVLLGGLYEEADIKTPGFRDFMRRRARAYIASEAPVDTPIAGPGGNDQAARSTSYGCPVHSSGTSWLTEMMFIDAQDAILAWGEAVARDPAYANAQIEITYAEKAATAAEDSTWADYKEEEEDGDEAKAEAKGGEWVTAGEGINDEPEPKSETEATNPAVGISLQDTGEENHADQTEELVDDLTKAFI